MEEKAHKLSESLVTDESAPQITDRFTGCIVQNKYEVREKLGEGGMGVVYRAYHRELQREYAIKFLLPSSPHGFDTSELARFEREARQASGLHHQNLVSVVDFGTTDDGMPYLVMDFVSGKTVSQLLAKEERLAPEQVLEIALQLCEGLQYAHDKGVIHRDLKPSNVMVTLENDRIGVRVLDFGVAKFNTPEAEAALKTLTATGQIVGSPAYMSPEQAMGYQLDQRSDIYALGCVIFEMLTGRPVFQGDSPLAIVIQHLNNEAPDIRSIPQGKHVRPEIANIVRQALQKKVENRYQSMADLKHDLGRVAQGHAPQKEFATARQRRQKLTSAGAKLGIAAFVTFSVGLTGLLIWGLSQNTFVPEWKHGFERAQFEKGERSLELYRIALRKAEKDGAALPEILQAQDKLMRSYNDRNQMKECLQVGEDALQLAANKGDIPGLAQIYDQMTEAELIAKNYTKATDYGNKAIEIKERTHQAPLYIAHSLGRLAQAYRQQKQYALAEQTNLKALDVMNKAGVNDPHVANIYLQLSNLYSDQEQRDKAIDYIDKAIDASRKSNGPDDVETSRLQERRSYLEQLNKPRSE